MDYTQSDSFSKEPANGRNHHEDVKAIPTVWSAKDANSVLWSLMAVVEAAGLAGIQFDKANPASYQQLLKAIQSFLGAHEGKDDPHGMYAFRGPIIGVPNVNIGPVITVQTPHIRQMIWDGKGYVRAPWHQPGMVLYSYQNPTSIPGYLPIRADLTYDQANYPDLAVRMGLSGAGTFSLVDLRGEFIRCLDNGRGVNAGRVLRSTEAGDNQRHGHPVNDPTHGHPLNDPAHGHEAWTDVRGGHNHAGVHVPANVLDTDRGTGQTSHFSIDTEARLPTDGAHDHPVGVRKSATGISVVPGKTGITIEADGSEARPRNLAFPAWVSY
jgi:hypothetical protein